MLLFLSITAWADENTLIDFTVLAADYDPAGGTDYTQHQATLMDYSEKAGYGYTDAELARMKVSLAIENFEIKLASSSSTVENQSQSYVLEAKTTSTAPDLKGESMADMPILAARIHFPESSFNSWAIIKPPFEIPAYEDKTTIAADGSLETDQQNAGLKDKYNSMGILKNVGVIKSISVTVCGRNFPHGLGVILKDQNDEEQHIFLGYLDFEGWRTLSWDNPNYITDVRNRTLRRYPLYPKSAPYVKFGGLILYRDSSHDGGDFVVYFKDVKVTYDRAVRDELRLDIDDESIWGIMEDREAARRAVELKRIGDMQVLRYLESQKMHEEETTTTGTTTP
jgi:hypothetical protein